MAQFTRWNNPNRRRRKTRKSYTDACIDAALAILQDRRLGYDLPLETYKEQVKQETGTKIFD